MNCYIHTETEAIGMCTQCGKPICRECCIEIQGRYVCRNCIARVNTTTPTKKTTKVPSCTVVLAAITGLAIIGLLVGFILKPPQPTPEIDITENLYPHLDPYPRFVAIMNDGLGESNRGVKRITESVFDEENNEIVVTWTINNASNLDLVKVGAQKDTVAIAWAAAHLGLPYTRLYLYGTYLLDGEVTFVYAVYSSEAIEQMKWTEFLPQEIWSLSDSLVLNPLWQ